jgi:HK97 family phage prohead protease
MDNMKNRLTAGFEIKSLSESGHFEGYASVFHRVDRGMDMILPGAFSRSIEERGADGIKLLWQHDPREPIGNIEEIYEDERGLFVKGHLMLDVQRAREALSLMRVGALDGLSIGFRTLKSRKDEAKGVRLLTDLDLWEVSLVTFPMQSAARIARFKSGGIDTIREFEHFLREAGGFSRNEAKALAGNGFGGLAKRQREADVNWTDVLASVRELTQNIYS